MLEQNNNTLPRQKIVFHWLNSKTTDYITQENIPTDLSQLTAFDLIAIIYEVYAKLETPNITDMLTTMVLGYGIQSKATVDMVINTCKKLKISYE